MEDCKINYDYTVRNAAGSIVQFLYGEDGIDPVKIESQMLPYIELDYTKLCSEYLWTENDDTTYYLLDKPKPDLFIRLKTHFDQLLVDREFMIQKIFNNKKENSIFYPISFFRIITIAKSMFQKDIKPVLSDLDPEYVMDTIEELCETLYLNKANKGNKFLNILLRVYLSPKKVCFEYRFDKLTFDYVVKTVKLRFYDSIANPSEMVGVVAAQSIGEPTTQLSQSAHTKILIYKKYSDKITPYYTTMGEFIDNMLNANKKSIINLGNDSVVYDPKADYYIVGVSDNEKTSWRRILQVSKHPANGDLMKVYTRSGKTTTATLSHSFLKRTEKSIVPVEGYDLKVGDRIPVAKYIPVVENAQTSIKIGDQEFKLDNKFGWLCGVYIADGNITGNKVSISKVIPEYIEMLREIVKEKLGLDISTYYKTGKIDADKSEEWTKEYESQDYRFNNKNMAEFLATNFGNGSYNKYIPGWVYTANLDFIRGVIGGYFDGDGNVADGKGKGMVMAHSVSEKLIENMIVLLCYIGVFGSKCLEAKKEEHLGDLHTIQISRKYAEIFKNEVGFVVESKKNALEKVIEYINDDTRLNSKEIIDKIPELGEAIAYIGRKLELPGQSRNYGRWAKKDSIGRNTLIGYIKIFEDANEEKKLADVTAKIAILKQAAYSDVVWDEIIDIEYIEDPKEYVYDFTVPGNDSFMVDCGVLVHNTLNSVDWETEMLFDINGILKRTKIGEFIDNELEINTNKESHPNDTTLGWTKEKNIKVLSCSESGEISWKLVEAVTKHPPINTDGSNTLLKVITHSGREVIATKAKSFLKRVNNKIIQVKGEDIKVGDYLPVSNTFPTLGDTVYELDVSTYLSKNTYLYMSEVNKSLDGCVYPMSIGGGHQAAHIPEKIPLTNLFGFFIGAYLAEGNCTTHHVMISNIDDKFNNKIDKFCKLYDINYHICEKIDEKGHSKTLRMHSLVLTELITKSCGRICSEKRIAPEFFKAPDEFISGLIDGYFSGDGTFSKKQMYISATSVSRGLVDDVQLLLTKYNIQSRIVYNHSALDNAIKNGYDAQISYTLNITACGTELFKQLFTITIDEKNTRLNSRTATITHSYIDIIPNIITETYGDITIQRLELEDYIAECKNEKDLEIFKNIAQENIVYDKIESITEIPSSHTHVYDLTVQDTRNFNAYNSLCLADTFHSSGISSASKTVRGVPRIKELLSVTKNIKSPSLTIYVKDEAKTNKKACTDILNSIQTTYFKDVVSSSKIYFDPDDFNTTIDDDKLFLATYKEFMNQGLYQASNLSPWLLRLEFSRDKLHENNITMMDIHYVLHEFYEDTISAMFSDDNSNNLVCRIKLVESDKTDESDMITELKALEKSILENIVIKGIKNINKVMMNKKDGMIYNNLTMQFESSYEWVLDTNGTNLLDILCNSKIDNTRTISNDINEIYETLGIEAARHVLFSELSETLAGLYVNYRHLSLLVDTMTNKGYLLSIDRHGINRIDIGPLAKCSFEESVDMVIKAGMFSEIDKINGVSANIMLGQIPPAGTGDTDILIDEQRLLELEGEELEGEELEMDTPQTSYALDDETKENICSNLNIEFEMPDIDKSFVEQKMDLSIKIV